MFVSGNGNVAGLVRIVMPVRCLQVVVCPVTGTEVPVIVQGSGSLAAAGTRVPANRAALVRAKHWDVAAISGVEVPDQVPRAFFREAPGFTSAGSALPPIRKGGSLPDTCVPRLG